MGERALRELHLPRGSFAVEVIHKTPFEVQWSCIADGLQAATGASAGKLNLRLVETSQDKLETIVRDRKTGEELVFRLQPGFLKTFLNLPSEQLDSAGEKVLSLSEEEVFSVKLQRTSQGGRDK
jgi:formylmethanofuran dehydrogenase subunit E